MPNRGCSATSSSTSSAGTIRRWPRAWRRHLSEDELGKVTRLQAGALGYDMGDGGGAFEEVEASDLEALLDEVEDLSPEALTGLLD